ncbi:YigZ family protein [Flavobacteriaceae bacterium]|nr:YigZ family protein [Flavobacteriaceae bacterium]
MEIRDTYKTISLPYKEVLFKDKNSKFFGYAYHVSKEEDVKSFLETLKKQHHTARHWCYAYQIGVDNKTYRANDDGEPKNSAGIPIFGQIQSFKLTNILIVVVRYFGGTKLGISGLINAYKKTAQLVLTESKIVKKTLNLDYNIVFDYRNMNRVMRIIKERKLRIIKQTLEINCTIHIQVRKKDASSIYEVFSNLHEVAIKQIY